MNSQINRRVLTAAALATLGLTSLAGAAVPSDFNKSGSVGLDDLQAFLAAYYAGKISADADGNGQLSYQDIITFSQQWVAAYSRSSKSTTKRPIVDGPSKRIEPR